MVNLIFIHSIAIATNLTNPSPINTIQFFTIRIKTQSGRISIWIVRVQHRIIHHSVCWLLSTGRSPIIFECSDEWTSCTKCKGKWMSIQCNRLPVSCDDLILESMKSAQTADDRRRDHQNYNQINEPIRCEGHLAEANISMCDLHAVEHTKQGSKRKTCGHHRLHLHHWQIAIVVFEFFFISLDFLFMLFVQWITECLLSFFH